MQTKTEKDGVRLCCICTDINAGYINGTNGSVRNPTSDWTLYSLQENGNAVKYSFVSEMCRLSRCTEIAVRVLMNDPSRCVLCYVHFNHSRLAQSSAKKTSNSVSGFSQYIFQVLDAPTIPLTNCQSIDLEGTDYRSW